MKKLKIGLTTVAVGIALLGAISGCSKSDLDGPLSGPNTNGSEKALQGFIFRTTSSNGFHVHNCNGFSGVLPVYNSYIGAYGSYNRIIGSGTCNFPVAESPFSFQRGATAGTLGPIYYVTAWQPYPVPSNGVAILVLRARNVAGAYAEDYNQARFYYSATTNTWEWSNLASTYFAFGVITAAIPCSDPLDQ